MPLPKPDIEKLKAKGDVDGLIKALEYQEDSQVRAEAACALAELFWELEEIDASTVESLIAALRDKDEDVRAVTAGALHGARFLSLVGEISAPAVESLIAFLKDEDWIVREAAAGALGEIGDARAVEPLTVALKDELWYVREAAARALDRLGRKSDRR
ncbi:MAG: HEAT repeat domain-containing protein [Moorellaceae bacterium]